MAMLSTDDQWPSLAPIRTSAISACALVADEETYQTGGEQPYSHGRNHPYSAAAINTPTSAFSKNSSFSPKPNSSRPISFSFAYLFPNCFSCVQRRHRRTSSSSSSSSPRHRCTPICMRKNKYALRSLAFLFPSAGKMQSFYSSTPTAKAQLSGAFPRTSSGKIEAHYSMQSQFSSPRTPASSKVQHFAGAIPSPRTPYGSSLAAASPSSAPRRRKPGFSLAMPPGVIDKKKAVEQIVDEPSSPHVTCIGRVRRQTGHCRKLRRSDTIDRCAIHRHQEATKKGTTCIRSSSSHHSLHKSNDAPFADCNLVAEQPTNIILEACTQRLKLLNLHKIQVHGDKTSANYSDQGPPEDTTLFADCSNSGVLYVQASQDKGTAVCMRNDISLADVDMNSSIDSDQYRAPAPECDDPLTESMVQQTTSAVVLKLLDEDGEMHAEPHDHQAQRRCLMLMRSTGSRRFLEADLHRESTQM